jgi:hypothetical protein
MATALGAGARAGSERIGDDGLDAAGAAAAFHAAAEAIIDLGGGPPHAVIGLDRGADILVAEDVAGTDDHEDGGLTGDAIAHRYLRPPQDAKGKAVFSSDSKLREAEDWNESKISIYDRSATAVTYRHRRTVGRGLIWRKMAAAESVQMAFALAGHAAVIRAAAIAKTGCRRGGRGRICNRLIARSRLGMCRRPQLRRPPGAHCRAQAPEWPNTRFCAAKKPPGPAKKRSRFVVKCGRSVH